MNVSLCWQHIRHVVAWNAAAGNTLLDDAPIRVTDCHLRPIFSQLGDRVVYSKYAGTEIEVGPEPHVLLKEDDCIGVMPPSDKVRHMC